MYSPTQILNKIPYKGQKYENEIFYSNLESVDSKTLEKGDFNKNILRPKKTLRQQFDRYFESRNWN